MSEQQDKAPEERPEAVTLTGADGEEAGAPTSPYRNLFVPLVIVPAMIVIVLVLVFVLFGQIAGEDKSMAENLQRVQQAGANERTQALFDLVIQVGENWKALEKGEEIPNKMEGDVIVKLGEVWEKTPPDDLYFRYVLASTLTQMGDPTGIDKLLSCLTVSPAYDADGSVRFNVLIGLALVGNQLGDENRAKAIAAVLPFLEGEDAGLRLAAAGALQNLPSEESRVALRGLLGAEQVELRGQAAVSLSHLGDRAGVEVLWELVEGDSFERARLEHPEKFRQKSNVAAIRQKAVEALVRLGRAEDLERLQEIAKSDTDLEVREAAMRGLAGPEAGSSPD